MRAGTVTVEALDMMPAEDAARLLRACCGASRWVTDMLARRPFGSAAALHAAADLAWTDMREDDWREAFSHHPRIGERAAAVAQDARGDAWSRGEQAGASAASDAERAELASVNREYERRFGHTYIVCATGRSTAEMLELARERLRNEPDAELRVAAEELRRIMQLRLEKLLGERE